MTEIWVLGGSWQGTGIAPLPATPVPTTPGTPLPCPRVGTLLATLPHGSYGGGNMAVGLISVAQLSLCTRFSGSEGMTEGYNLLRIGRIINHYCIPGLK